MPAVAQSLDFILPVPRQVSKKNTHAKHHNKWIKHGEIIHER